MEIEDSTVNKLIARSHSPEKKDTARIASNMTQFRARGDIIS